MSWKLAILGSALVVATLGVIVTNLQEGVIWSMGQEILQSGSDGTYADGVLVLNGIATTSIYGWDRKIEYLAPDDFVARWCGVNNGGLMEDPLMADLDIWQDEGDEESERVRIALLGPPSLLDDQMTYQIDVLEGSIPERFVEAMLYFRLN